MTDTIHIHFVLLRAQIQLASDWMECKGRLLIPNHCEKGSVRSDKDSVSLHILNERDFLRRGCYRKGQQTGLDGCVQLAHQGPWLLSLQSWKKLDIKLFLLILIFVAVRVTKTYGCHRSIVKKRLKQDTGTLTLKLIASNIQMHYRCVLFQYLSQ